MAIIQWNCRGYCSNYGDLVNLIKEYSTECICLQETLLGNIVPSAHRWYTIYCLSNGNGPVPGSGLAALVHGSTSCLQVPLLTPLQAQACTIGLRKSLTICNIYISPNKNISYHDITVLIVQLPPPFILMGDTNAKCELWGGTTTDHHGRIFGQLLLNMNIGLLNSGARTHYHSQTNSSSANWS